MMMMTMMMMVMMIENRSETGMREVGSLYLRRKAKISRVGRLER